MATLVVPRNKSFLVNNLVLTGGCKATRIYIKVCNQIAINYVCIWRKNLFFLFHPHLL